jgi:hypothetical protein
MDVGLATAYQVMLAENDLRSAEAAEIQAQCSLSGRLRSILASVRIADTSSSGSTVP